MVKSAWNFKQLLVLACAGLALAACANDEEEINKIAEKYKMNKVQLAAFNVCVTDLGRIAPRFEALKTDIEMREVPYEVCACQSTSIVQVFKDNQYGSHLKFAKHMVKLKKRDKPVGFISKDLKASRDKISATKFLMASLMSCGKKYQAEFPEEGRGLFKNVPKPPDKKKDKTKEASAAH